MRIDPHDWPRWTMKDFDTAYRAWVKINVTEPWERTRALSFYVLKPYDSDKKLNKWSDVFDLKADKKKRANIFIRKLTKAEKEEFEKITGQKAE